MVWRADSSNAVCLQHHAGCNLATPYGNYCEHPEVYRLPQFKMQCVARLDTGKGNAVPEC